MTITAEDNDIDAPAKELTVSAAVTLGPTGLAATASQTLTITDDETAPSAERNGDADGVGAGCLARGVPGDFALSANQVLTNHGGSDVEHRDGDDHGRGQRHRRSRQGVDGIGR